MAERTGAVSGAGAQGPRATAFLAVVLAAALWGTSGVLRSGLALELPAPTVVAYEHLLLTAFTLPWLAAALRTFVTLPARARIAIVLIGVGSSALATTLFTLAFTFGDPTTPLLLQKLQPIIAVLGAAVLLGERPTPRFLPFAAVALVGAYLISFPEPFAVGVDRLAPALLALAAASLWAAGTVFGRSVAPQLSTMHLTTLRFAIGLPAAMAFALARLGPAGLAVRVDDVPPLIALALGPGLLAIALYYRGLARTPASLATFGELAFPFTAVLLGWLVVGQRLVVSQWVGLGLLLTAITALTLVGRHRPLVRTVDVPVPSRV